MKVTIIMTDYDIASFTGSHNERAVTFELTDEQTELIKPKLTSTKGDGTKSYELPTKIYLNL